MRDIIPLPSLNELRRHVLEVLCRHDQLDPSQTPLSEALILRRNRPCGLFFQVSGPRLLKAYAIWAGEENRLLFYDNAGNRFAEVQMSDSPDPRRLAA